MTHRIRALLLSLVVVAAVGLLPVATAPSAHADQATDCMDPSLSGRIVKMSRGLTGSPIFVYDNLVATTPGTCADSLFSTVRYDYKVSFYYWWKDRVSVDADSVTSGRGGSTITFPATSSPRVTFDPWVGVRIDAYRTNTLYGFTTVETQRYVVDATAGTTTWFDTATMTQAYDCTVSHEFPTPHGSRAMCP